MKMDGMFIALGLVFLGLIIEHGLTHVANAIGHYKE